MKTFVGAEPLPQTLSSLALYGSEWLELSSYSFTARFRGSDRNLGAFRGRYGRESSLQLQGIELLLFNPG
jgi:hypothetical protein